MHRICSPRSLPGLAILGVIATLLFPGPAPAADYGLGPQDRVRLKVYEWRASRDVIFEWTALNDEFIVGADGSLSLPFVGTIAVEDLTPDVVGGLIGERLVERMGLGRAPDVSVEVVQFRPFYITGDVVAPGEFPYRPGMSVLQAVSIAGGLRTRRDSLGRIEREVIAAQGEVSLLSLSHMGLLARRARLLAEINDAEAIAFPASLTDRDETGFGRILMQQEQAVFAARSQGLTTQLRALTELRSFLERETDSLQQQLGFLDRQIESVRQELGSVTTLVEQGLAVAPRQLALERSLLQVQSDRLAAETAMLRVRQEGSRTDISILQLKGTRRSEVADLLRETEVALSEIGRRTDTALLLLRESETAGPRMLAMRKEADRADPTYTIVRPVDDRTIELAAAESTQVEPGDTVKVEVPLLSPFDLQTGFETDAQDAAADLALPVVAGDATFGR